MSEVLVIIAALVGGLISWAATWQVQNSRAQSAAISDASLRLETRRWEAYVDFCSSANSLYSLARRSEGWTPDGPMRERIYEGMAGLDARMSAAFLVSTNQEVRDSIAQVVKTSRAIALACAGGGTDYTELDDILRSQRKAVTAAERSMRQAIGYAEE